MARPRPETVVAMLVACVAATGGTRPSLGRAASHRREGARDRRVGLLATWPRHRRTACRQPYTVSLLHLNNKHVIE